MTFIKIKYKSQQDSLLAISTEGNPDFTSGDAFVSTNLNSIP